MDLTEQWLRFRKEVLEPSASFQDIKPTESDYEGYHLTFYAGTVIVGKAIAKVLDYDLDDLSKLALIADLNQQILEEYEYLRVEHEG